MKYSNKELVRTSKFLSLVLRHQPDVVGLELEPGGWLDIDLLIHQAAARASRVLTRDLIERVVSENDKQRFAISDDRKKIRANQGHSLVNVQLDLTAKTPPDRLFHGTVERFISSIQEKGLLPGARNHVHLSADQETAKKVGSRRGKPVVLVVESYRMWSDGKLFFLSENGVWLTEEVPPQYLEYPGD